MKALASPAKILCVAYINYQAGTLLFSTLFCHQKSQKEDISEEDWIRKAMGVPARGDLNVSTTYQAGHWKVWQDRSWRTQR